MSVFWFGYEYQTMQVNGQRFIGPPQDIPEPPYEWELFVKHLPRHIFEQELIPLFSTAGFVYQIRLLMCFSGLNRGIAYVRYTNEDDFQRALAMFHQLPLGPRFVLYACRSLNMRKLVLLNIDDGVMNQVLQGFVEAISGGSCVYIGYRVFDPSKKFAIIQFRCHYETALARRKLMGYLTCFGDDCYLKWYNREKYLK
ncbi:probable RNA-binding protein 46 [Ochlerotatus camptorhynchus]|uniref:probable RNA-binding protein 46 n=1 Tax=Ochlerotatus camptorhynchus TaxID=644619 RepID=UPI0031E3B1A0